MKQKESIIDNLGINDEFSILKACEFVNNPVASNDGTRLDQTDKDCVSNKSLLSSHTAHVQ